MKSGILFVFAISIASQAGAHPHFREQGYTGTENGYYAPSEQESECTSVKFFPQCSMDEFLSSLIQCNRNLYNGYPYRYTSQCLANVDEWLECMNKNSGHCMSSDCPSHLTSMKGAQKYLPILEHILQADSLRSLYISLDDKILDIVANLGITVTPELKQQLYGGIANLKLSDPEFEGLTVHQIITEAVCPQPGMMARSLQRFLPSIQDAWNIMSTMGITDTSDSMPFCDGDFTSYLVNNVFEHIRAFYKSKSRDDFCQVQKSLAYVLNNMLNKKCDFDRLAGFLNQVGFPVSVIEMARDSPQILLEASGCRNWQGHSNNQMWSSNNQQYNNQQGYTSNNQQQYRPNYQSNYNDLFTGLIQTFFQDINANIEENEKENKCKNGDWKNSRGSYQCNCYSGWQGDYCNENINECEINNGGCVNGVCNDTRGSFECKCYPGWKGDLCNQDINECETAKNGGCVYGTCINNVGSFLCACRSGWKGTFCDENINECEINNGGCVNGVCNDTRGSFECKCRAGWQGTLCDQDIDECKTANNGGCIYGDCINSVGSFQCVCNMGWEGTLCDKRNQIWTPSSQQFKYNRETQKSIYSLGSQQSRQNQISQQPRYNQESQQSRFNKESEQSTYNQGYQQFRYNQGSQQQRQNQGTQQPRNKQNSQQIRQNQGSEKSRYNQGSQQSIYNQNSQQTSLNQGSQQPKYNQGSQQPINAQRSQQSRNNQATQQSNKNQESKNQKESSDMFSNLFQAFSSLFDNQGSQQFKGNQDSNQPERSQEPKNQDESSDMFSNLFQTFFSLFGNMFDESD